MSHILIALAVVVGVVIICVYGMHRSLQKIRNNKFKELILDKFRTKYFTTEDLLQEMPGCNRRHLYLFILGQELLGRIISDNGIYRLSVGGHKAYTAQFRDCGGYSSHPLIA